MADSKGRSRRLFFESCFLEYSQYLANHRLVVILVIQRTEREGRRSDVSQVAETYEMESPKFIEMQLKMFVRI